MWREESGPEVGNLGWAPVSALTVFLSTAVSHQPLPGLGSQGQAEMGPLASQGTALRSHSPSSSGSSGSASKTWSPFTPPAPSPRGIYYWLPSICPTIINQGEQNHSSPKCGVHKRRRALGATRLQGILERAEHPGQVWTHGAECLAGDSCWCSGPPAPAVSPQTLAPWEGNSGCRGGAGRAPGLPPSRQPQLPDRGCHPVLPTSWAGRHGPIQRGDSPVS